jgi:anhydro-N-acetylmuramic acid kinase
MSGTSIDGIDAAMIRTDGESHVEFIAAASSPYKADFRDALRGVLGGRGSVEDVERELTDLHALAVEQLLWRTQIEVKDIDVVGFHGQTILHEPDRQRTWQIGDGARLARRLGIPVVADFRSADMRAGGQGAPFAPVYHYALSADLPKPLAVLNIGGVANVTWIGDAGPETMIAFDTGPGNALIDDWMATVGDRPYDADGAAARRGQVNQDIVALMLRDDFAGLLSAQSLDRLSLEDGAATLTALTVESIALSTRWFPAPPMRWAVTGGGRKNGAIMDGLRARLTGRVDPVEKLGRRGDSLEAEAFAYMAARRLRDLPLSFPGTTGCTRPTCGGVVHQSGVRDNRQG